MNKHIEGVFKRVGYVVVGREDDSNTAIGAVITSSQRAVWRRDNAWSPESTVVKPVFFRCEDRKTRLGKLILDMDKQFGHFAPMHDPDNAEGSPSAIMAELSFKIHEAAKELKKVKR